MGFFKTPYNNQFVGGCVLYFAINSSFKIKIIKKAGGIFPAVHERLRGRACRGRARRRGLFLSGWRGRFFEGILFLPCRDKIPSNNRDASFAVFSRKCPGRLGLDI